MLWWLPLFIGFALGYLACQIKQWLAPPEDGFVPPPNKTWKGP